jgi:hypothetical protein
MQYLYDGELYKIVKITGPKHNMLALGFDEIIKTIEVIDLEKSNMNSAAKISSEDVKNQVLFGISEMNNELGTNYKVCKIQFIGSDTPSNSIYIELAKQILKRLESGETFVRI